MQNPHELPLPDDPIERVHTLARDLAYGATINMWGPFLDINVPSIRQYLDRKWGDARYPTWHFLTSFGYTMRDATLSSYPILTQKAFDLLQKPLRPPQVFVSYRRQQSSAFALLIEARLRIIGVKEVFIDKYLVAGDTWHGELEQRIRQCETFICLIAPTTLGSDMVKKEIEWADDAGSRIISIWHGGCKMGADSLQILRERQCIEVREESARDYETAVNELLNSLGYRTY